MLQSFREYLEGEKKSLLWRDDTRQFAETVYKGILICMEDELYLQEFMPFGQVHRVTSEHVARSKENNISIEDLMEEHLGLRDAFWEVRNSQHDKNHDFVQEKRICQCFNSLLQVTVQAFMAEDTDASVSDPFRDAETGVFNSHYFHNRLEEELKRSKRFSRVVSIMVFKVDAVFEYGTGEYDDLTRAVARSLRRNTRDSDVIARLDESMFAILLPGIEEENISKMSVRLKERVYEYLGELGEEYQSAIINCGVANYPEYGSSSSTLVRSAIAKIAEGG